MKVTVRDGRWIALFTLAVLVVLTLIFRWQLGAELPRATLVNVAPQNFLYELVFYGFVLFLFNRRASLWQLAKACGVCLGYRLLTGLIFSLLISVVYSMNASVAMQFGVLRYLPLLLVQIVVAPFALRPVVAQIIQTRPRRRARTAETNDLTPAETTTSSIAISREQGVVTETTPPVAQVVDESPSRHETAAAPRGEVNGFDRATRYIGEHASVHLATVVDHEGLMLSCFKRGDIDPEQWAPFALVLREVNGHVLERITFMTPEKIDLAMKDKRVVVASESWYCLMVIADRQIDDFLSIRINQGMDIIRKYVQERFGSEENAKAERIDVSSTQ